VLRKHELRCFVLRLTNPSRRDEWGHRIMEAS
jgi:hypothetical protein